MRLSLLLLLITARLAAAQVTVTLSGPAAAKGGSTITLTLSAVGAAPQTNTGAGAYQWIVGAPAGATLQSVTAAASGKTVTCTSDQAYCLLYDLAALAIAPNGSLATISVRLPASAAAPLSFPLSNLLAAAPDGLNVGVTPGTPYAITVASRADINNDGRVDNSDVAAIISQILGSRQNPSACTDDQNGDGQCNLVDLVIVIRARGQ